jgi:hypothetical protein
MVLHRPVESAGVTGDVLSGDSRLYDFRASHPSRMSLGTTRSVANVRNSTQDVTATYLKSLLPMFALILISTVGLAVLASGGKGTSDGSRLLLSYTFALFLVRWVAVDRRSHKFSAPFEFDAFVFSLGSSSFLTTYSKPEARAGWFMALASGYLPVFRLQSPTSCSLCARSRR